METKMFMYLKWLSSWSHIFESSLIQFYEMTYKLWGLYPLNYKHICMSIVRLLAHSTCSELDIWSSVWLSR